MNSLIKDTFVKHNLGKLILLMLTFVIVHAEDFSYDFHIDNTNPYVKEAILLTLEIQQTNKDVVLLFNFDLKKSEAYQFQRVGTKETDTHHNVQIRYTYLIYPLKAGHINLEFDLLKQVTTDESIAYSYSGDRDNVKGLVTKDTQVTLPSLPLKVKPLPEGTLFVGDFTLKHQLKTTTAKPYEPFAFQIQIEGWGYPPLNDSLLPKKGLFTRFTEQPIVKSVATVKGTQSSVNYPMALSHSESFDLPAITLKAFNPKTEKSYLLSVPAQHFTIQFVGKQTLLDSKNSPKPHSIDWSWLKTLLAYLVVFVSGYLSALAWKWKKAKAHTSPPSSSGPHLHTKIAQCKDKKMLLQVLMATGDKRFSSCIQKLESSLYGDGKITLSKAKQEAQEQL